MKKGKDSESNKKELPESFAEKRQERLVEELNKIETVEQKLKDKYHQYETLVAFIRHLASTEKIFVMAREANATFDETKEKFLETETHLMALESGIEEEIFKKIMEDFHKVSDNIASIYTTADSLREKYEADEDKEDCLAFIEYIRDSLVAFWNITNNGDSVSLSEIDQEKRKILEERMKILSADGNPELEKLQRIYEEFEEELKKRK